MMIMMIKNSMYSKKRIMMMIVVKMNTMDIMISQVRTEAKIIIIIMIVRIVMIVMMMRK